ncbi:zinc finger HIT domain-containing protein 3 isoform X2 [Dunckerocampus dactyliophorus]|uniref:zinc finger HIT domain-containing protein 3 isoform X2 n=1 Tax=Dunckerocampus dactyliophorus TaxID=161453 RepID=UPI002405102F|nr:zinc finger HIT domain-containing protein 3 isoform X2 [Dunckerocampus dactyliophorus]
MTTNSTACSVPCYKRHKDSCLPVKQLEPTTLPEAKDAGRADTWSVEDLLQEDDIPDKVPPERLQLLGQSEELKDLLCNPHLRHLLRSIDSADSKEEAMKAAMQEPLFVEFSDQCLKVVQNEAHSQEVSEDMDW